MFSNREMIPSSATGLFSAYASVAASTMLIRSMANEIVPQEIRSFVSSAVKRLIFKSLSSELVLTVDEFVGMSRNEVFDAAELYLRTKITPSISRISVSKLPRQASVAVSPERGQKISDEFDKVKLTWQLICSEQTNNSRDKKHFEITFDSKFKSKIIDSYIPYVLKRANSIRVENRVIKLYSRDCPNSDSDGGGNGYGREWGSVNLEHPATFETLAMDPKVKKAVLDDLDRFLRRRDFYKKVGRAWKRGYLLYGPPGTGKSSLIAAMANYLKFDVYDVELTDIYSNSDLRRTLLATTNRSILVIEDIDCSTELKNRDYADDEGYGGGSSNGKFTLSGLLNFIDGLWSSCGDERIIVFTTNHKDRLDPALLRPGRMDMHIHMSYCTKEGFKTLANNYLGIQGNEDQLQSLYNEIEGLIAETEITPAEIAEELMKSDDADMALRELSDFLKSKKTTVEEKEEKSKKGKNAAKEEKEEELEEEEVKKLKTNVNKIICRNIGRRVVRGRFARRR